MVGFGLGKGKDDESEPTEQQIERSRKGIISAVTTFYGRLNSWLSSRFNRNLSDPVGEAKLAEKMVEILEIEARVLGPFELACIAHAEYYAGVLVEGNARGPPPSATDVPDVEGPAVIPDKIRFV